MHLLLGMNRHHDHGHKMGHQKSQKRDFRFPLLIRIPYLRMKDEGGHSGHSGAVIGGKLVKDCHRDSERHGGTSRFLAPSKQDA